MGLLSEITFQALNYYREKKFNKVTVASIPSQVTNPTVPFNNRTVDIVRLAPATRNPQKHPNKPSRIRRTSDPTEIRGTAFGRRISLDCESFTASIQERPVNSIKVNNRTSKSQPDNHLTSASTTQQVPGNTGNNSRLQSQRKRRLNVFSLIWLLVAFSFVIGNAFNYNSETDLIYEYVYQTFIRIIQYCTIPFWICESDEISQFTLTKSKRFLIWILSLRFLPMSIQNLANFLQ